METLMRSKERLPRFAVRHHKPQAVSFRIFLEGYTHYPPRENAGKDRVPLPPRSAMGGGDPVPAGRLEPKQGAAGKHPDCHPSNDKNDREACSRFNS